MLELLQTITLVLVLQMSISQQLSYNKCSLLVIHFTVSRYCDRFIFCFYSFLVTSRVLVLLLRTLLMDDIAKEYEDLDFRINQVNMTIS